MNKSYLVFENLDIILKGDVERNVNKPWHRINYAIYFISNIF